MTPLEIIALLFAVLSLTKLVVIIINKKAWANSVAMPIYSNPKRSISVFTMLAIIIFYFIIQELSVVQIFAVIAFSSMLVGIGFMQHADLMQSLIKKAYSKKLSIGNVVYVLVWLALLVWVVRDIFLR